jgi:hypothetical protein
VGRLSRVLHTTQDSSTSPNPDYDQLQDIESVIRIVNVRQYLSTSVNGPELFGTKDPMQLAEALQDYSLGVAASTNSILLVIDVSINILESPANTGFAFFVRLEASRWGLETVLLVFESAVFLSQWVLQLSTEDCPNEGTHVTISTYLPRADYFKQVTDSWSGFRMRLSWRGPLWTTWVMYRPGAVLMPSLGRSYGSGDVCSKH